MQSWVFEEQYLSVVEVHNCALFLNDPVPRDLAIYKNV
jgi:hypothetical protein